LSHPIQELHLPLAFATLASPLALLQLLPLLHLLPLAQLWPVAKRNRGFSFRSYFDYKNKKTFALSCHLLPLLWSWVRPRQS